jgi:guanylate kinase
LGHQKGKIFVLSAPSGAGKTTIIKSVLKDIPELVFSVSATTRRKRENETEGLDYFFLTESEFKNKIELDEFIEWEKVYDYYYGTLKSFVKDCVDSGKSILLEVDVKGGLHIKELFPESIIIFISPPSIEELKNRLKVRNTETESDFEKRIARAGMELSLRDKFDYIVVNNILEEAIKEVENIIIKNITKE